MARPVGAWPCAVGSWVSTAVKNYGTAFHVTGGGAGAHMTIKSSGPFTVTFTGMSKLYYEDSGVTGYFRYGGFLSGTLLRGQRVQLAGAHGYEFFLKGINYADMTVTIDLAGVVETHPEGSGEPGAGGGGSAPWSHGYFECYGSSLVLYDMNVPSGSSDWTFARR